MKKMIKFLRSEDGQAIPLIALIVVVLLGFAAIVIDTGMVAFEKANMQAAADAAALAGAQDLPKAVDAKSTAKSYAQLNGAEISKTIVTTPFGGDKTKIEVVCSKNVQYFFARVFGFSNTDVSARAVAQMAPQWAGEALPFLNLDDDYKVNPKIEAWEKTGPGDFESLWPDEYHLFNGGKNDDHSQTYFTIDYEDGIEITKGTVATIKQEVGYIFDQHKPVYIFSLSSAVIKSGKYNTKLKNKDVIPLADLVLLQVTFDSYDYSGKTLYLTVTKEYDINKGDYPSDHLHTGGNSKLVE